MKEPLNSLASAQFTSFLMRNQCPKWQMWMHEGSHICSKHRRAFDKNGHFLYQFWVYGSKLSWCSLLACTDALSYKGTNK